MENINKDILKAAEQSVSKSIDIPIPEGYIPIELSSHGRHVIPAKFYMRDYYMNDILKLGLIPEDSDYFIETLTNIYNGMVLKVDEKPTVDIGSMTIEELNETLMILHKAFIGPSISKLYFLNPNLPEGSEPGQLYDKKNIAQVDLPIACIGRYDIDKDKEGKPRERLFKEPFGFYDESTNKKYYFNKTKIRDALIARKYCMEKNRKEFAKFEVFHNKYTEISNIVDPMVKDQKLQDFISRNVELYQEYDLFKESFDLEYYVVTQVNSIVGIDDKVFTSLEEKIEAYEKYIPKTIWPQYREVLDEYKCGLNEYVTFYSDELEETVTRRFQFQSSDFIPTNVKKDTHRYTMLFD